MSKFSQIRKRDPETGVRKRKLGAKGTPNLRHGKSTIENGVETYLHFTKGPRSRRVG
jgi:hypothetical protein